MSTLTSLTLPLAAATARSSAGPSWRHGPHQVAQKSTITGVSREASSTSAAKLASVASLITSPPGFPAVSPIRVMVRVASADAITSQPARWSRRVTGSTALGHDLHGLEIHNDGFHADGVQEAAEAFAADAGGAGVDQRVEVDPLRLRQRAV